ncbi:MAG: hypothetical protein K8U03_11520 [Planctomycetia bacterium]|nr:hypothetical protein [Planctomycetia bacterium]
MLRAHKSLTRIRRWWLAIVIALLCGCHHNTKTTTASSTTGSNLRPVDSGRAIYTSTCTHCHSAKTISNYSLSDWTNTILPDMAGRAGLSTTQSQDVLAYVQSVLNATP